MKDDGHLLTNFLVSRQEERERQRRNGQQKVWREVFFELAWMLTRSNRVEEVQREEEVDGSACMDGKNCTTYYIFVEILAFGGRYGHARSIRWLSFRKTGSKTSQKKNPMRSIMRYALYFVLPGSNICIFMNICEQMEYLLSK
jgi:hypothetical protein